MNHRTTFTQPEWEEVSRDYHLSQALRVGDMLYVSGHTGDPESAVVDQIREAFEEVGRTLALAGAEWRDVVHITSYHVGLREHADAIVRIHNEFAVEEPYPTWTAVGVTELVDGSVIEVQVIARLSDGAENAHP